MFQSNKQLKKKIKKSNNSFQRSRDIIFTKNSIILKKNQASRNIYFVKQGEAVIVNQQDQVLHTYKQGTYLNFIESSLQLGTFKTIKAFKKCHITFQIWNNAQNDKYKRQILIPRKQQMKFYQIPMFVNLPYELSLELAQFFCLQKHTKNRQLSLNHNCTYFIVQGNLLIINQKTNMNILKLQKGQMLSIHSGYKYNINSQYCRLIKISSKLLKTILGEHSKKFQNIEQMQLNQLKKRSISNENIIKKISFQYKKYVSKHDDIPEKFKNKIQLKIDKLQRAKSVNYMNNNKDFTSFSDQKRKILQNRDKGYKKISQLNRRNYGRNYILSKRLEISRNIYQGRNLTLNNQSFQNNNCIKRGITLYQSVTLKDDYGIMKQRPFLHLVAKKKNSIDKPLSKKSNQIEINNITLTSVKTVRLKFQKKSKSLYNFCAKKHVSNLV